MYRCETWDYKEGWVQKNWCFQIVVLDLESPLDCKEIRPVNPEGNQLWIFTGRTDAEAPILWLPDVKNRLTGKDPDAGKDWKQKEKGRAEDEMVGWHHWLNRHESEQAPGDRKHRGAWCTVVHGVTESDRTQRQNNNSALYGTPQTSTALFTFLLFFCLLFLNWICAYLDLDLIIRVKILFPNSLISFLCPFKSTLEPL